MPAANANCNVCHGAGDPNGCTGCGGTTPAQPPQRQTGQAVTKSRKWPKVVGALLGLGVAAAAVIFGVKSCNSPSATTETAMNGKQPAPAATGSTNLDPAPKADPTVAQAPDCPDGSLWDTKKKVCVERSAPPPFPSAITVNIPCPSNCAPAAPPPATASASAPAPKPPGTSPVVPVKANATFDLTKIGNGAVFPSGT